MSLEDREVEAALDRADEDRKRAKEEPPEERYLAVWFTPSAIREHFDRDEDEEEDAEEAAVREWVAKATDEELRSVGEACISSDSLWSLFHELINECAVEAMEESK